MKIEIPDKVIDAFVTAVDTHAEAKAGLERAGRGNDANANDRSQLRDTRDNAAAGKVRATNELIRIVYAARTGKGLPEGI